MKPQIRMGQEYQAVIPLLSEVKPRPANEPEAKEGSRGGTLVPLEAVLASVIGPEKAASDALPMDAKMDPIEGIGEPPTITECHLHERGQILLTMLRM
jgi:hypothetical protein